MIIQSPLSFIAFANAELGAALACAALDGLDRLLATQPSDEPLPAGEIGAIVRLIREAARPAREARSLTSETGTAD